MPHKVACPKCFLKKIGLEPCPNCGFDEVGQEDPLCLPFRARLVSRYLVGCRIGKGRKSITYLVKETRPPFRILAVKEYFPRDIAERSSTQISAISGCQDEFSRGLENFLLEGDILKRASHPNIVRGYGSLRANGTGYILMEYCEGLSLQQFFQAEFLRDKRFFDEKEALSIMLPILEALEELHGVGLVHCDVSANNIHLVRHRSDRELRPILLDFGSAQFSSRGQQRPVTATRGYSPPEQHGPYPSRFGPATDIYACGATLYFLVTGSLPEPLERNRRDRLEKLLEQKAPDLSRSFKQAICEALSHDPEDRPTRMSDLYRTLARIAEAGPEPPPSTVEIPREPLSWIRQFFRTADRIVAPVIISILLILCLAAALYPIADESRLPLTTPSKYIVPAADYYLLRDASASPDFSLYGIVEDAILATLRSSDASSGDRSSYAIFADDVTDGLYPLQPASEGEVVSLLRARSTNWLAEHPAFRRTTRFDRMFDGVQNALRNGEEDRRAFIFVITDGVPDRTGDEDGCLVGVPSETFLGLEAPLANLIRAQPRVEVILVLAGGHRECGGYIFRKWGEVKSALSKSESNRFHILNLTRYDGLDQSQQVSRDLRRTLKVWRRASCVTIRPVYDSLFDSQRAAFDNGKEFSIDYILQGHLGDGISTSISRAEILDSQKHVVGELDVVRRPQGHVVLDKAIFVLSSGNNRDGGEVREPMYFQSKNGFAPEPSRSYFIRVEDEQEQLCERAGSEIKVDPGRDVRVAEVRRGRMECLAALVLSFACAFVLCAVHYHKRSRERRGCHWLFRKLFVKPFLWWIAFFCVMSVVLAVLSIVAFGHGVFFVILISATAVVCILQYLKISSQFFRSAEPGPSEVLIVALESIIVPLLSLVLSIPAL